jgi:nucleoid-associated protein YgaU
MKKVGRETSMSVRASCLGCERRPGQSRPCSTQAAATGFATELVGFTDPVVGEFQQGDARSGEVEVRAAADGPVTTVLVRQVGSDDTWSVLGAATAQIVPTTPAPGATQTGARTYKITAKDSLWKIAEREVGKAKAYAYVEKILDANPNLDAERLRLGQTITLPAKD